MDYIVKQASFVYESSMISFIKMVSKDRSPLPYTSIDTLQYVIDTDAG